MGRERVESASDESDAVYNHRDQLGHLIPWGRLSLPEAIN